MGGLVQKGLGIDGEHYGCRRIILNTEGKKCFRIGKGYTSGGLNKAEPDFWK